MNEDVNVWILDLFGIRKLFFQFFGDCASREATSLDSAAEGITERAVFFDSHGLAEFRDAEDADGENITWLEGGGFPIIGILSQGQIRDKDKSECQVAHDSRSWILDVVL